MDFIMKITCRFFVNAGVSVSFIIILALFQYNDR